MKSIKVCEYSRSRSFHYDLILQDQASGERSQDQWSSGSNSWRESLWYTGNLPLGGLPRNHVTRITDLHDMTLVVDHGHEALTQTNKTKNSEFSLYIAYT